jgi:hypothetical protein
MCFGMGGGGAPQVVYRDKEVMVPAKPADPLLPPPPSSSGLPQGLSDMGNGQLIDSTPATQAPATGMASAFRIDPNAVDQSNLDEDYSLN